MLLVSGEEKERLPGGCVVPGEYEASDALEKKYSKSTREKVQ